MADLPSIQQRAQQTASQVFDNVNAQTGSCWLAGIMAGLVWVIYSVVGDVALLVAWIVANIGAPIADSIVNGFSTVRNAPSSSMNSLIGDTLGEFFGADFDTSNLSAQPGTSTNLSNMQAIGADIYNLLANEFVPGDSIDEQQGVNAAQAFMGFATNFAVRSAFVGITGELLSLGFVKNFRELGEDVAQALGLGRMVRRALQPLIQTTISTPLTWSLNRQYRPKRMDESQLLTAFKRNLIDDSEFADNLQQLGWPDDAISILLNLANAYPNQGDAFTLVRYGVIDQTQAVVYLKAQGYNEQEAALILQSEDAKRADAWVNTYIKNYAKAFVAGQIDETTFDGFVQAAPMGDIEKQWISLTYRQAAGTPHRKLTIGEETKAFEENIITLGEYEDALLQAGFNTDDAFTLMQIALLAIAKAQAAAAAKAAKAAKSTSTTAAVATPVPPAPTPTPPPKVG